MARTIIETRGLTKRYGSVTAVDELEPVSYTHLSLVPLILAVVVMGMMFRNTDDLMERANQSITTLNSVMIEYIGGMKLIKAYNMGSKSFQKFSDAIQEENLSLIHI